jgi:hypothetical protein
MGFFLQNIAKAGIAKGEFGGNVPESYSYGNDYYSGL